MGEFSRATAITSSGERSFAAVIPPGWDIVGRVNGGYLMAVAARASAALSGRPAPVTMTAHFLAPAVAGPVAVTAEVLKAGKRFSTVRAAVAGDRTILEALGTFGDGDGVYEGYERIDGGPPDLPEPDDCIEVLPTETFPPPFVGRIEMRIHPDNAAFGGTGRPRVSGWVRLRDGEPIDEVALLMLADSFPPAVFFTDASVGWVPTVELTVHVRRRPVRGWLRGVFTSHFITDGMLEEDGELWDESGRLVAQSRQLALVPR
ncbi:MAG: thioesterase family protein [Acidimicrobiia bacterium]